MTGFHTILIANRGEIARRILRSARSLGYRTVVVYSEADAAAPQVAEADRALCIGPAPVNESYLSIERILAAAQKTGADAIHPGYGFLAENAAFAEACHSAGLTFIGPSPEAIELMGNKRAAKERVESAGVPALPGYHGAAQDDAALIAQAESIGLPLMVKAAAGGGGRGLRRVEAMADLPQALASARSEASNAFGSGELLLEKALDGARHVEVQVLADHHGTILHLGERECSLQRRHQKVIEEAPSPAVSPDLRKRMGAAAVAAAHSVDYRGAGTVEFLLAPNLPGEEETFYFLEMNTRLQVEHPVTEAVTGLDLVDWQLRIAAGEALPFTQDDVSLTGHAIEARLYAEDAEKGFLPRTGKILAWKPAEREGVRTDHALAVGLDIGAHYDPLLAKVIAHGRNREEARRRLLAGLEDTVLLGPVTNKPFLAGLLRHPEVIAGEAATDFITSRFLTGSPGVWKPDPPDPDPLPALAAVMLAVVDGKRFGTGQSGAGQSGAVQSGTRQNGGSESAPAQGRWRIHPRPLTLSMTHRGETGTWAVQEQGPGRYSLTEGEGKSEPREVALLNLEAERVRFAVDGVAATAHFARVDETLHLDQGGRCEIFTESLPDLRRGLDMAADAEVHSPMAGKVLQVRAQAGETVKSGDILVVLEAMKMEHEVAASAPGTVSEVTIAVGDQVKTRQVLVRMEPKNA